MAADSSALTEALYELSSKKPKLVKGSNYEAPADNTIKVTSWKMNEFKYYDVPSPFPTLARGLFTTKIADEAEDTNVKYRIVVRGYDKFFNIGETPWTNVSASLPSFPSLTDACSNSGTLSNVIRPLRTASPSSPTAVSSSSRRCLRTKFLSLQSIRSVQS